MPTKLLLLIIFIGAWSLTGCDTRAQRDSVAILARAKQLSPADPQLAEIYNRSCATCHATANTTAPLTGDAVSWHPRMAKGMDLLLENVINGSDGMPPFGLCMDCNLDQFEALINFMAQTD